MLRVGLVSDTHGVFDPALAAHFAGVAAILHAGDVGSHGGAAAVLARFGELGAPVTAVRGNVDDDAEALASLPETALLQLNGWRILLAHILADAATAAVVEQQRPDIVLHGHSHKFATQEEELASGERRLLVNPGSAGPARFSLPRTAALLLLPVKGSGAAPIVQRIDLAPKAPPRLAKKQQQQQQQQPPRGRSSGSQPAAGGAVARSGRQRAQHAATQQQAAKRKQPHASQVQRGSKRTQSWQPLL